MKDFYSLNFNEYPKDRIKLFGLIDEKNDNQDDLEKVIIEKNEYSNVIRYLVLPIHRFCYNYKIIMLSNDEITKKDIYSIIYDFYNNTELSLIELKNLNENDCYDYITDMTINKKENHELVVHPIDIMGDKTFIESISIHEDNAGDIQYTLHLGS